MSYVSEVLQPGEIVRHVSKIHWMVYVPGLLLLVAAIVLYALSSGAHGLWESLLKILALLSLAAAAAALFIGWFRRWTTEIAVTDRRIIFKRGFIRRHTIEMHMDKVESVDVDQSLLGRLLDYGDIFVRGTGAGLEPLHNIEAPLEFRNHVTAS